jgi:uncharacterized protein YyaL (SSP411 family)
MNYGIPVFVLLASGMLMYSCHGQDANKPAKQSTMSSSHPYTNELIHESSPYLLQHAHNPVNWYPWGGAAMKKAKAENKMLIISIGYAACHWCHVMEHESFEDTGVARLMNDHFVAIKVDREERPDIDQIYMTAAQLITGGGGWPLNAVALADGQPFYAGTYFPKKNWMEMLSYFIALHTNKPGELVAQAEAVTKGIRGAENVSFVPGDTLFTKQDLNQQFEAFLPRVDFSKGGTSRAPKFPMPSTWEFLLQFYHDTHRADALKAVDATLTAMARGGIYDQLGGGFARYSTDADWHVPHFEKMLYDNAQLVSLYAHAYQLTKNPLYKKVVVETLEFINRELTSPEGGFYASLDADSEGEEGKFYVWTNADLEKLLGDRAPVFEAYYNCTAAGNWEHGNNILLRKETDAATAKRLGMTEKELTTQIAAGRQRLLAERAKRIRPALDHKILTAWNALMLKGCVQAYRALGDQQYLDAAIKNAVFLEKHALLADGEVLRSFPDAKPAVHGLLDDYAFTISAFIDLYHATFQEKWLWKANELAAYSISHFADTASGMLFYTHDKYAALIARKMEVADNVIPSSNSEMANNFFRLGLLFYNDSLVARARQMLVNVKEDMGKQIAYYANWGTLEIGFVSPPYEVAILGAAAVPFRQSLDEHYLPNVLVSGGAAEGGLPLLANKLIPQQTTIYVCSNKSCKKPVTAVAEAVEQLSAARENQ